MSIMRLVGRFAQICARLAAAGFLLTGAAACAVPTVGIGRAERSNQITGNVSGKPEQPVVRRSMAHVAEVAAWVKRGRRWSP